MFICTWIIYFICFFTTYFTFILYIMSGGVTLFNSLIQCQIQGEIERPNKCYFLCLKFYIEPRNVFLFMSWSLSKPPPPILSQVNLNLALLDLYSIPSDFCIILEWYSVYGPYGVFVFLCNAYSFISYRQGLCLLYIYCIYCTKMAFLNIV